MVELEEARGHDDATKVTTAVDHRGVRQRIPDGFTVEVQRLI